MKRILFLCFLGLMLSCDDGDLPIETIDFDSVSIQDCGNIDIATSNILFKINNDEALILTLQSGVLKNEASNDSIISTVPSQSKVTYRIFSDNVTKNYFCDAIPATEPLVIDEIEAEAGEVTIKTILDEDGVSYKHTISLKEISLVSKSGQRITDLRINEFGTITTKP